MLYERVTTLLSLFCHVEQHRRVPGELLDAGESVVCGVESRLQHPKRDW